MGNPVFVEFFRILKEMKPDLDISEPTGISKSLIGNAVHQLVRGKADLGRHSGEQIAEVVRKNIQKFSALLLTVFPNLSIEGTGTTEEEEVEIE